MPEDTRTKCEGGIMDGQMLATPADEARCVEGGGRVVGGSTTKCFIVTAATGSPDSEELVVLRQLRDRVRAASRVADALIDAIYEEYAGFSPALAAAIEPDPFARGIVRVIVVRPLVAWYSLAGQLALDRDDEGAVAVAADDVFRACSGSVAASAVVPVLQALRSGGEPPVAGTPFLRTFAPGLRRAAQFPLVSWAILDPLTRAWKAAAESLDPVNEVAEWLASAPLEAVRPFGEAASAEDDLERLARFFEFSPAARLALGRRLLGAWPDSAAALRNAGFVV